MEEKNAPKGDKVNKQITKQANLIKKLEEKMKDVETSFNAKIEALHVVIEAKEKVLSKLNQEVGYLKSEVANLKQSSNFLSQETTDIKTLADDVNSKHQQEINVLKEKAVDLEDRSRRSNLVFYGIEEVGPRETENCEARVLTELLLGGGVIREDELHGSLFDRAHRLGGKKPDQNKPRPIIARFTSYKDKEEILNQSYKLRDTRYGISEDFSKPTLQVRSELVTKAKVLREKHDYIKGFKLNYRRLSIKYENPESKTTFFRSFSLSDTRSNPNWYLPTKINKPVVS